MKKPSLFILRIKLILIITVLMFIYIRAMLLTDVVYENRKDKYIDDVQVIFCEVVDTRVYSDDNTTKYYVTVDLPIFGPTELIVTDSEYYSCKDKSILDVYHLNGKHALTERAVIEEQYITDEIIRIVATLVCGTSVIVFYVVIIATFCKKTKQQYLQTGKIWGKRI